MKLTTKGRYAVTAMLDLAMHQDAGPVTLADIAERQQISQAYLEQLFGRLRKRNLVDSIRGPNGGYLLAHIASEISVADIIQAIDEPVDITKCAGEQDCQNGGRCLTHDLWENLNKTIFQFLNGVTLAQLMQPKEQQAKVTWHKQIR